MKRSFLALALCLLFGCSSSGGKKVSSKRGVEVVLEIDPTSLSPAQLTQISRLRELVGRQIRMRALAMDSSAVVKQDKNFIYIEIPSSSDPQLSAHKLVEKRSLKKSLGFYHASTVTADEQRPSLFRVGKQVDRGGSSVFSFEWTASRKEIRPGTSVYGVVVKGWKTQIVGTEEFAWIEMDYRGGFVTPILEFTPDGAEKMSAWCTKNARRDVQVALVIDGLVVSIAPLRKGTIISTSAAVEGAFEKGTAEQLAESINTCALSADLLVRSQRKF